MKVSDLENIIIKNTYNVNMIRARNLLYNKALNIDIYKVDNFYNIYGKFKSDNKLKKYNPHLRIDIENKKVSLAKCNCSVFEDSHLNNNIYICEHLASVAIKFVEEIKKRLS